MSDEPATENQTNGHATESTEDQALEAAAVEALGQMRGSLELPPEVQEMQRAPLPVKIGMGLGAMVAGAEQELHAQLVAAGGIGAEDAVPREMFEAAVLKPIVWALVAVAQQRGLELDALTDEMITAWTAPEPGQEEPQEGATETAGEAVAQQG